MRRKLIVRLLTVVCMLFSFSFVFGEVGKGDFGVGINYPGLGARYFLSDKISLELKGQFETNITVGGLRGYYYFNPKSKSKTKTKSKSTYLLFAGLEGDYVSFKGDVSKGTGLAGELFIGGEYFFTKSFSLQLDLGPALISLTDKDTSESVNGVEYVTNFGINYYFGKGGK